MKLSVEEVSTRIEGFDFESFGKDHIAMLVSVLPLNEEIKELNEYDGPLDALTAVSAFLKGLVSIPRVIMKVSQ